MKTYSILKNSSSQLSIILTTIFLAIAVPAQAGKQGGGGGNICRISETQSVLLDLDRPGFDIALSQSKQPGHRIQVDDSARKVGFFPVDPLKHRELRQAVLARLERTASTLSEQKAMIYRALFQDEMKIIGVNERFNHAVGADFSDSLVCSKNNTTAVFVYAASILFLSVPAWNELSLDTQADLFVNEGDRHIQKLLGVPLTNREVQTLTWSILQNPNTTQKDLSFINTRLAEYKGVAKFQEAFCQYAVEFGQNPTFPRVLVQEISKICENPLLALDESPILRAELSKISEDFSLSDEVLKRARDLSEFVAQVKLTAAAKAFANNSNMIGSKMIHLAIELGSRTLLQCQNEYSPEKCQNTINSFQDILNAGMIW